MRLNSQALSRREFQGYCLLSALVALAGGGSFLLLGAEGVPRVTGAEYPALVDPLTEALVAIPLSERPTFDLWFRVLGWYWLSAGLMSAWITPRVEFETAWFRFVNLAFMAVGVASALTISQTGTNAHLRYDALLPQIGIPLTAIVWQTLMCRAAKRAAPSCGEESPD